jgi:hypothetical protein
MPSDFQELAISPRVKDMSIRWSDEPKYLPGWSPYNMQLNLYQNPNMDASYFTGLRWSWGFYSNDWGVSGVGYSVIEDVSLYLMFNSDFEFFLTIHMNYFPGNPSTPDNLRYYGYRWTGERLQLWKWIKQEGSPAWDYRGFVDVYDLMWDFDAEFDSGKDPLPDGEHAPILPDDFSDPDAVFRGFYMNRPANELRCMGYWHSEVIQALNYFKSEYDQHWGNGPHMPPENFSDCFLHHEGVIGTEEEPNISNVCIGWWNPQPGVYFYDGEGEPTEFSVFGGLGDPVVWMSRLGTGVLELAPGYLFLDYRIKEQGQTIQEDRGTMLPFSGGKLLIDLGTKNPVFVQPGVDTYKFKLSFHMQTASGGDYDKDMWFGLDPDATDEGWDDQFGEAWSPPPPPDGAFVSWNTHFDVDIRKGTYDYVGVKEHDMKLKPGPDLRCEIFYDFPDQIRVALDFGSLSYYNRVLAGSGFADILFRSEDVFGSFDVKVFVHYLGVKND